MYMWTMRNATDICNRRGNRRGKLFLQITNKLNGSYNGEAK